MQEMQLQSPGQEDTLEKEMATHSVFLPEEFHEQRSYSPWFHRRVGHDLATKQQQQMEFIIKSVI